VEQTSADCLMSLEDMLSSGGILAAAHRSRSPPRSPPGAVSPMARAVAEPALTRIGEQIVNLMGKLNALECNLQRVAHSMEGGRRQVIRRMIRVLGLWTGTHQRRRLLSIWRTSCNRAHNMQQGLRQAGMALRLGSRKRSLRCIAAWRRNKDEAAETIRVEELKGWLQ